MKITIFARNLKEALKKIEEMNDDEGLIEAIDDALEGQSFYGNNFDIEI